MVPPPPILGSRRSQLESEATTLCQLDGLPLAPCSDPQHYQSLAEGPHLFAARAIDLAGNISKRATWAFTVDTRVAAPRLVAKAIQRQRGKRVVAKLQAGAGEPVRGVTKGRISVKGTKLRFRLGAVGKFSDADQVTTNRLTPIRKAHHRRIFNLLDRGYRLHARLAVSLRDQINNRVVERTVVALR